MKKYILTILLCFFSIIMSAQTIIGGNISFGGMVPSEVKDSEHGLDAKTNKTFNIGLTPRFGFLLVEQKLEVGGAVGFEYNQDIDYVVTYQLENDILRNGEAFKNSKTSVISIACSPYIRYKIASIKKFGIWFEGVTTLSIVQDKKVIYYPYEGGYSKLYLPDSRTQEEADRLNERERNIKNKNFTWGVAIKPVLTHDLNEHWRLETGLNFMCLGISGAVNKYQYFKNGVDESDGYITRKTSTCSYNIGVWKGEVLNVSALTIGAVYKF